MAQAAAQQRRKAAQVTRVSRRDEGSVTRCSPGMGEEDMNLRSPMDGDILRV